MKGRKRRLKFYNKSTSSQVLITNRTKDLKQSKIKRKHVFFSLLRLHSFSRAYEKLLVFLIKTISVRFCYDIVLDCRSLLEFQPRNMTMNWKGKLLIEHVKMFCSSLNVATRELILYNFWISVPANHLLSQRIEGVQKTRLEKLGRLPWLELRKEPSPFFLIWCKTLCTLWSIKTVRCD